MATISSIVSKLTLDTSQFNTRLQRSRRRAKSWGRDVSRIGKRVGLAVAAGATVAAVGLAAMTSQQLEQIDSSAKFARSIDLQVEKLAGLRHAADLNGVGNDKFDKSLQRMVRSIGDANSRGGSLKKVFDDLGVSSEELATMSPDEQLATLADAFSSVEDRSMAASMAQQIFGREGTALLNLLNQGSGALRSGHEDIAKYGRALTDIDAAAVEEANDQFALLKVRLNGVQQEITVGLAPYLTSITQQIIDIKAEGVDTTDAIQDGLQGVNSAVKAVVTALDVARLAIKTFQTGFTLGVRAISYVVLKLSDALEYISDGLGGDYKTPEWLKTFDEEISRSLENTASDADEILNRLLEGESGEGVDAFFNSIEEGAEKARQAARDAAAAAKDHAASIAGVSDAYEAQLADIQKVDDILDELRDEIFTFGMSDLELKIFDLKHLGASKDEILEAMMSMKTLQRLQKEQDRADTITGIVEDLEKQVQNFGLSEDEKTLRNLEALGAGDDQIKRAVEAIRRIQELEKNSQVNNPMRPVAGPSLIRAGSAAAQQAAFTARRSMDPQLAEQKKQTDLQKRMADGIDRLTEQGARVSDAPAIAEVGIE